MVEGLAGHERVAIVQPAILSSSQAGENPALPGKSPGFSFDTGPATGRSNAFSADLAPLTTGRMLSIEAPAINLFTSSPLIVSYYNKASVS